MFCMYLHITFPTNLTQNNNCLMFRNYLFIGKTYLLMDAWCTIFRKIFFYKQYDSVNQF